MDAFSYLSVLLSIVIGLGLTQVLTACGRIIRYRDHVRFDWIPLLWAVFLIVVYVQVWWSMFGLRLQHDWTFAGFLLVLAQTATLYLMAALVLPEQLSETGVDLRAHYERHHRWFFAFLLATLAISVAKDVVLSGRLPTPVNLMFHAALGITCLSAILIPRRRFHEVIAIGSAAGMTAYIAVLFARLR